MSAASAFGLKYRPISKIIALILVLLLLFSRDPALQATATIALIWTLWATSLNVVWGFAGQFSMAQVALGGVAAYTYTILAPDEGWGVLLTAVGGIVAAVLCSALIGFLCLRLAGFRFAIMTLAFALAGVGLASSLEITGRSTGISVRADWPTIEVGFFQWDLDGTEGGFSVTLLLIVAAVFLGLHLLLRSRLGRGLIALRDDEILAESIGIDTRNLRIIAFVLGAVVAGIAGVMQAQSYHFIYPSLFTFDTLVNMIVVLVLGGRGRLFGALVGGIIYAVLTTYLSFGGNFEAAVFGALVILIVIFAQRGVTYYLAEAESWVYHGLRRRSEPTRVLDAGGADLVSPATTAPNAPVTPPGDWDHDALALEVDSITKSFGGVCAVNSVSFFVRRGEILGVIGPNGAGKTTLFNLISGFILPDSGAVTRDGSGVTKARVSRRVRQGLVRTFQQPRSFATQTTRINVAIAAERGAQGRSIDEAERVEDLLAAYGLLDVADRETGDLSYGTAKRLGVAMATAARPEVVLLDEPAAGLNASDIDILRDDLTALKNSGVAVCIVEHHMDLVMEVCDRIVVLDAGTVIASGTPSEIAAHPQVIEAYLGGVNENA